MTRAISIFTARAVTLPLMSREIPVIADPMVDPKFGTGVVKVTPAHDPNDFEVGQAPQPASYKSDWRRRAHDGRRRTIRRAGSLSKPANAYSPRCEESGELVKTEPYTVSISKCDRSKTIIEPLVSTQWFVHMKPLAAKAMEAVRAGRIRFVPDDREALFFQWMENIRDWCISRQLWWGHRIPAWHCANCDHITVARETPATCPHCQSTELEQDAGCPRYLVQLRPVALFDLGLARRHADLRAFYPTSLLITGFDILFFWLSRMIMLGTRNDRRCSVSRSSHPWSGARCR